jgi:NAD(P)-dependent dehydrogenase (short-subunit alcohol dehydrogenase family)
MTHMDFSKTTVLVTGASRGIGRAIVSEFLKKDARVIGVSTTKLEKEFTQLEKYTHVVCDLSEDDSADKVLSSIPKELQNIDILVNNAGIKVDTEFQSSKVADWNKTLNTNLRSAYFLSQSLTPILSKSKNGRIINIASQSGVAHVSSSIEYGLSKAGMIYITKSLAKAVAKFGITVNAVSPGRTYSDMTGYDTDPEKLARTLEKIPLHAINTPEEIAKIVLFLANASAHNITGQVIGVDGGEANF